MAKIKAASDKVRKLIHIDCAGQTISLDMDKDMTWWKNNSQLMSCGNKANPDEHFSKDGYVYKNHKRIRKWFETRENWKYFWKPCIENIPRIESIYHKLLISRNKQHKQKMDIIKEILKTKPFENEHGIKKWLAHAKPLHKYKESNAKINFWLYIVDQDQYSKEISWQFEWTETPSYPINLELGTKFHYYDRIIYRQSRLHEIHNLLNECLTDRIRKEHELIKDEKNYGNALYEIVVNNRKYFFRSNQQRHGYFNIETVTWPDDGYHQMVL